MKIYGDYHIHSEFSRDARATVDEIAQAAKEQGLFEIAITDHGPGAYIVGSKLKNFPHIKAICERAAQEHKIKIFCGIEANVVGSNGQIDVPADYRKDVDILLCGIHVRVWGGFRSMFSFFIPNCFWRALRWTPKERIAKNTRVMKSAIEKNDIDVWVHPAKYFKLDVVEVAKTCAERGTLVELNAGRRKLSFRPIDFERMLAVGAKFVISTDSHRTERINQIERVIEFLKYCDYNPSDIVNLVGPYKRPKAKLLANLKEEELRGENLPGLELDEEEKRAEKKKEKEQKQREKVIKRKRD